MSSKTKLPILRLDGGARARGLAHGEHLKERIAELLERWGDELERGYGVCRRRYVELFFANTAFEATLAAAAPQILAEVRGIADGSGLDYRRVLAFQHVNEEFAYAVQFAKQAPAGAGEACSTIVSSPAAGRPSLVAQNLDLAEYLDGFQCLLRMPCDSSDGEIITLTVPGMISLMGMNSHGFAVCDNALTQLRTDPHGIPIFALYRMLLESASLRDAVALIERLPHAVGLNWVMGAGEGVAMIERSAGQAVRFGPHADGRPAYHTNHPLVCDDWTPSDGDSAPSRSTYLRLASLHQRLHRASDVTIETLKAALCARDDPDYPVSRGGGVNQQDRQIGFTLASNVFELRRGDPTWHMAAGPPHARPFHIYRFD